MFPFAGETDCGAMAGNGGKMATERKQLKEANKRSIAKSKATKKPRKKPEPRAKTVPEGSSPVADPEGWAEVSTAVDPDVNGAEKLRDSVNQTVAANASKMAKGLAAAAAKGNAACGKLILDLISRKPDKSLSKGMSKLTRMLADELEWTKPETDDSKKA